MVCLFQSFKYCSDPPKKLKKRKKVIEKSMTPSNSVMAITDSIYRISLNEVRGH